MIAEANELSPEMVDLITMHQDIAGAKNKEGIEELEKQLGSTDFTKMMSKFLENFPALKAIVAAVFWDEFMEAMKEWNIKKREAMINLVKLTQWNEQWELDFSTIKEWDLDDFFKIMDSYGSDIDYSQDNFWENLFNGKVAKGDEQKSVTALSLKLKWENKTAFLPDDYKNENEWFLKKLNSLAKKEEVSDANWATIKTATPWETVTLENQTPAANDEQETQKTGTDK